MTSVRAEPGQVVSAGQPVISLALTKDVEVSVAVPEHEIVRLKAGDPADVALWAAPSVNSAGKIREIASAADAASRTYAVRVTVAHPVPEMRLGMTTSVSFTVAQDKPPLIVPMAAFTEENGRTIAYVAGKDRQTVSRREVSLDGVADEGVKVKSGLVPGEIVVTGGVQFLKDGMRVRLPKEVLTAVADSSASVR